MLRSVTCLLLFVIGLPTASADVRTMTGRTMGTTYAITAFVREGETLDQTGVDECLAEINARVSTYDPQSELSRFNASRSTDWFEVSDETARVVAHAKEIYELTEGAFDPTVGKVVRMWGFGPDVRTLRAPENEVLEAARVSIGMHRIEVRRSPPALRKHNPLVELDLSAIAKGDAVDTVTALLRERGVTDCLVEIGGEVRAMGTKHGHPWRLGIERPAEIQRSLHAVIELSGASLATSGDYRNYFEQDGIRYSHLIDPKTARPVTHQLASVSIVSDDCMTADALATALLVMGPDDGLEFANDHQITAFFLVRRNDGFTELASLTAQGRFLDPIATPLQEADVPDLLATFLITAAVFGIALLGLAAGLILSNRQLRGSCGGTTDSEGRSACDLCTTPPEECERMQQVIVTGAGPTEVPSGH